MVVPLNLSPLYMRPPTVDPEAPPFILSYGLVLAITAIVLALRRHVPGLPAAWLAYVVILLPVLGIFHSGSQIAADRYTYLAGLGWAILAGAGLLSCWHATRFLIPGCAVCLLVGLGVLTWNQAQIWHDSEKLWSHAAAIDPGSPVGQYSLGLALARQRKLTEAIEHFKTALRIKPDYADAHTNVGAALADQGKLAEGIDHYREALQSKPDDALAHYNWGLALAQQGKLTEAIEHYRPALRFKPDYAVAHINWGVALAQQGKLAEASEHYRQALQLKPDSAEAHANWGLALADQGKLVEAIDHYRQALQIKPDSAEVHIIWGTALADRGRLAEAGEHYRQALRIKPDHAAAQSNLLNVLRRLGTGKEDAAPSRKGEKSQ